jgi:hypothetical protein
MGEEDPTRNVTVADNGILQFDIDPDPETAEYDLLAVLADQEGVEMDELPSLYETIDEFVEGMFRNPPSREAQLEMTFSYAGHRVTVNQSGHVTLVPVKESLAKRAETEE